MLTKCSDCVFEATYLTFTILHTLACNSVLVCIFLLPLLRYKVRLFDGSVICINSYNFCVIIHYLRVQITGVIATDN